MIKNCIISYWNDTDDDTFFTGVTLVGQDQIALNASRFQDVIGKMDIAISQWNVGVNMGIMGIFANMLIVLLAVIHSTAIAFARILVGVTQVINWK